MRTMSVPAWLEPKLGLRENAILDHPRAFTSNCESPDPRIPYDMEAERLTRGQLHICAWFNPDGTCYMGTQTDTGKVYVYTKELELRYFTIDSKIQEIIA